MGKEKAMGRPCSRPLGMGSCKWAKENGVSCEFAQGCIFDSFVGARWETGIKIKDTLIY